MLKCAFGFHLDQYSTCAISPFWKLGTQITQNHLYGLSQRPGCPRGGLLSENALHGHTGWFLHSHGRSPNPFSTRVHPNPIHRGQAPYTPEIFHRPTAYAAGVPARDFPRTAETHGTSRRDMRKCASTIFDERLPFRWLGIGRLCFTVDVCDLRRDTVSRMRLVFRVSISSRPWLQNLKNEMRKNRKMSITRPTKWGWDSIHKYLDKSQEQAKVL